MISPLIEMIAAAQDSQGNRLAQAGGDYYEVVVPANGVVQFNTTPGPDFYMYYLHAVLIDKSVVPGTLRASIYQYGAQPFFATVQGSATEVYFDFFVRVSHAQPLIATLTNLTNLNQGWANVNGVFRVSTEDNYKVLEKMIARHCGMVS